MTIRRLMVERGESQVTIDLPAHRQGRFQKPFCRPDLLIEAMTRPRGRQKNGP